MTRLLLAALWCAVVLGTAFAQENQASPFPSRAAPTFPPAPGLPTGADLHAPLPNDLPGAAVPPMPGPPGAPGAIGARPMPPTSQAMDQIPGPNIRQPSTPAPAPAFAFLPFLESLTPFVQAFDFVLMLVAGVFCLRARKKPGLTILAIACFVSAIILLGFFLSAAPNPAMAGLPLSAQARSFFYLIARLLAPIELLLFVIGIVIVARRNRAEG